MNYEALVWCPILPGYLPLSPQNWGKGHGDSSESHTARHLSLVSDIRLAFQMSVSDGSNVNLPSPFPFSLDPGPLTSEMQVQDGNTQIVALTIVHCLEVQPRK